MLPIYCCRCGCVVEPTPASDWCIRAMYMIPLFLFHVSWFLGCFLVFRVLCFAFIFSTFVSPETHIEYSTSSYSKQEVERKYILYNFIQFFCCHENHPREVSAKKSGKHVKTFHVVCEVQCCVNFKSRSHIFLVFSWLGSSGIKQWRRILFLSFHRWVNWIRNLQIDINSQPTEGMCWVEICAKLIWFNSVKDFCCESVEHVQRSQLNNSTNLLQKRKWVRSNFDDSARRVCNQPSAKQHKEN